MELLLASTPATISSPSNLHLPYRGRATAVRSSFSLACPHRRISSRFFLRLASKARRLPVSASQSLVETSAAEAPAANAPSSSSSTRWRVVMERPPNAVSATRADVIDYYVQTLARVLPSGSEKEAQMCIYRASWQTEFFFCCDVDEDSSQELAGMPGVVSVRPDRDIETVTDNSGSPQLLSQNFHPNSYSTRFSPSTGNWKYWLVKMGKPGVEVVTKAQMVDYFTETLTKVMGNEKDAQVSIYNISWEKDYGFCCQIDEECARELSDVPGMLSVQPDENFDSENKKFTVVETFMKKEGLHNSPTSLQPDVKAKRLFVTGLSFYTSEKTLRAAFEPFGELVEVKIIMDKISKRSKGYAFIEYTTEEAGGAALKEMNGKIINGWMIVVDVAKTNPPKHSRVPPRPSSSSSY